MKVLIAAVLLRAVGAAPLRSGVTPDDKRELLPLKLRKARLNSVGLHKWAIEAVAWPLMEKRKHNQIREFTAQLQASQWQTPDALLSLQQERLTPLLLHCREHVPAYQQSLQAFTKEQIEKDPMGVLKSLPVLSKRQFREQSERYRADNRPDVIANSTGGSTGVPLRFYMDRPQVESYEAARWRGLSWYGITPGSRSVMIWGNRPNMAASALKKQSLYEWGLKNRITISAYDLSLENIPGAVKKISRFSPEYLYGYANGLDALATLMLNRGLTYPKKLKAVVSTAEDLLPEAKKRIEAVFDCPVVNEYGAKDAGILGYTCEKGHLHLTVENGIFELLDPVTLEAAAPGERGVLAVTDLHNYAMPRLRYLLADVLSIAQDPCACGRGLPVADSINGREETLLQAADGTLVHGSVVCVLARQYPSIARFQIEQVAPDRAILRLERDHPTDEGAAELQFYLEKALKGVKVELEDPAEIKPEASGKYRYAIRRFELQNIEQ